MIVEPSNNCNDTRWHARKDHMTITVQLIQTAIPPGLLLTADTSGPGHSLAEAEPRAGALAITVTVRRALALGLALISTVAG